MSQKYPNTVNISQQTYCSFCTVTTHEKMNKNYSQYKSNPINTLVRGQNDSMEHEDTFTQRFQTTGHIVAPLDTQGFANTACHIYCMVLLQIQSAVSAQKFNDPLITEMHFKKLGVILLVQFIPVGMGLLKGYRKSGMKVQRTTVGRCIHICGREGEEILPQHLYAKPSHSLADSK